MRGRSLSIICNLNKELPSGLTKLLLLILLICFVQLPKLLAQGEEEYYEIAVNLDIQRVGATEMDAVIKGNDIYLSVNQLFSFLKINNTLARDLNSVEGFFIGKDQKFTISRTENIIDFSSEQIQLKAGDLIKTEFDLYLLSVC